MQKTVEFKGVSIYTESFGDISNPAILLIMGAASSLIWWDVVFCQKLVDQGYFVIRYDNRDTGQSTSYPVGKPGYTFEEMSDDAIRLLDAYNIDKAIIMGMSMGGMLAQMIALRHPDRLLALVLHASMYFAQGAEDLPVYSEEVEKFFNDYGTYVPVGYRDQVDYAFKQWQVTHKSERNYNLDEIYKMVELDVERAIDYNSKLNHSFAEVTGDELVRIHEIKCPTLVIHGTVDNVIPYVHGEMLEKTIPNAKLLTLNGAGHELHPDDYDVIIEGIVKLIA
jgi:pimeloyl-ACP methyl ester carboxylesterase